MTGIESTIGITEGERLFFRLRALHRERVEAMGIVAPAR